MPDLINQAGDLVGLGGGAGGSFPWTTIIIVVLILLFVGLGTVVGVYFLVRYLKYKYKIVIFKKVNGVPQPVSRDKARTIVLNTSGDQVLKLRKNKKTLPMPEIQTGKNTYWYYIGEDGEWFNFGPGDFDENRRELNADFLDKEMRYARTSLDSQRKERYDKESWWDKYGNWVVSIGFIALVGVFAFLYFRQFSKITSASQKSVETANEVMSKASEILGALDNLQAGGSGIQQNMVLPFMKGVIG